MTTPANWTQKASTVGQKDTPQSPRYDNPVFQQRQDAQDKMVAEQKQKQKQSEAWARKGWGSGKPEARAPSAAQQRHTPDAEKHQRIVDGNAANRKHDDAERKKDPEGFRDMEEKQDDRLAQKRQQDRLKNEAFHARRYRPKQTGPSCAVDNAQEEERARQTPRRGR